MIDEATGRDRAFFEQYVAWFHEMCGEKNNNLHKGRVWTPNWICPSPATIKDPDLRASAERLALAMQSTPLARAIADFIGQDHPVSAVSRNHASGIKRHGAQRTL